MRPRLPPTPAASIYINPHLCKTTRARDPNFDGYLFRLDKLNQFGGNYVEAEMVRAFIVSAEYRQRFSQ